MNHEVLLWVGGGGATILGSFIAARVAGQFTVRAAKVSADEGAFVRAKDIYESGIADLEDRLTRYAADQLAMRNEIAQLAAELSAAREEIRTLRRSVSQYEGRVIQLQEVLRLHHIEVPPWTSAALDGTLLPPDLLDPNQPPQTLAPPGEAP